MLQKIKNIIVPIIGAFILSGSCSKQNEANLKDDALELMNTYSIQVSEPSGLAINSEGTNLYTVSDNTNKIYKLSSRGTILKTYNYEGNDLEGVVKVATHLYESYLTRNHSSSNNQLMSQINFKYDLYPTGITSTDVLNGGLACYNNPTGPYYHINVQRTGSSSQTILNVEIHNLVVDNT